MTLHSKENYSQAIPKLISVAWHQDNKRVLVWKNPSEVAVAQFWNTSNSDQDGGKSLLAKQDQLFYHT